MLPAILPNGQSPRSETGPLKRSKETHLLKIRWFGRWFISFLKVVTNWFIWMGWVYPSKSQRWLHPPLEATGAPRFGKSRRGGVVDGFDGMVVIQRPENTKGVIEIQTSLFHVVSFLATLTRQFVDVEKVWKDSCDLSLPLRCCVVSWKRAATKARLSRLLMYTEIWQVSSIINEVCRHPGTACHEGKHPLWELTRSFQTAFCTGSNYSYRISMKCAYISIYNIYYMLLYTMNYLGRWLILDLSWQPAAIFGGVPEAEVPYDIAWVNVGDLGHLGRRSTWHALARSTWIPKELEPLGELARDFSPFFFLAFQSGKDEIPLVQMKMERHGHWGNGCKVMSCDSCVSETESQCKWFSKKAWNTYKYKRHINVFICTKMCTMMCSIKIALTLGVHHPRGMVMDLVKFIVFLDQAIKKWVAKVDATHHTSRIALQIWSDGGADPLEVLNLPTHSWTWS